MTKRFRLFGALLTALVITAQTCAPVSAETETGTAFPAKFDLRDRGVVTPVKNQNPWGTCWAFAAISAAESSILTKMGKTYAETGLDLSERHLAWYVASPVTENISKTQATEGLYLYNQEAGPNHIYTFGGTYESAATLFAQGIGPVAEADCPYRGAEGNLAYEDMLANKEKYIKDEMATLKETYHWATDEQLREMAEEDYEYYLQEYAKIAVYSPLDDWSISDPDEPGSGKLKGSAYTFTDSNFITYWYEKNKDFLDSKSPRRDTYSQYGKKPIMQDDRRALYQDSVDMIKGELQAGRGVSVSINISSAAINSENWTVFNDTTFPSAPHVACIVGWDDNYPAENFAHTTTPEGNPVKFAGAKADEATTLKLTTPPANGAWIVKNSWGSETDAIPGGLVGADGTVRDANSYDWGIVDENGKHTGYFYLSYYDPSIGSTESYDFDLKANHDQETALQYDFVPATVTPWIRGENVPQWEANIYTLDKDMRITDVGTRIRTEDGLPLGSFDVTFDLYKLREGAVTPDDGEHIASCTRQFKAEGYHRTALNEPIELKAGDRLGITVQQSHTFDNGAKQYFICAGNAAAYSKYHNFPVYGKCIVNEGESFLKIAGVTDQEEAAVNGWMDMTAPLSENLVEHYVANDQEDEAYQEFQKSRAIEKPFNEYFSTDNFSIKVFGEPMTDEPAETTATVGETTPAGNETTTTAAATEPAEPLSEQTLCDWAKWDYCFKTGKTVKASVVSSKGGKVTIALTDPDGNQVDTYVVDAADGIGTDAAGAEVNLPQTGNNSMADIMLAAAAFMMLAAGAAAVYGASRRRKEENR